MASISSVIGAGARATVRQRRRRGWPTGASSTVQRSRRPPPTSTWCWRRRRPPLAGHGWPARDVDEDWTRQDDWRVGIDGRKRRRDARQPTERKGHRRRSSDLDDRVILRLLATGYVKACHKTNTTIIVSHTHRVKRRYNGQLRVRLSFSHKAMTVIDVTKAPTFYTYKLGNKRQPNRCMFSDKRAKRTRRNARLGSYYHASEKRAKTDWMSDR